jgi:transcriptional regulator with XRE-family HTH domain
MPDAAHPVDLRLTEKLKEPGYRKSFFLAEASAKIAAQLIALRKRRGLSQSEVAELTHTRQPAISRAERADYHNWSFNALRSIADALDARIRVLIEPAEDVLPEYEQPAQVDTPTDTNQILEHLKALSVPTDVFGNAAIVGRSEATFGAGNLVASQGIGNMLAICSAMPTNLLTSGHTAGFQSNFLDAFLGRFASHAVDKDEIDRLRKENARLTEENKLLRKTLSIGAARSPFSDSSFRDMTTVTYNQDDDGYPEIAKPQQNPRTGAYA